MEQLNKFFDFLNTIRRVLIIKDSVVASLFSGILGTLAMDVSNFLFWRTRKTEALYGHIAGSVYVNPLRTKQQKNFWLGQITHLITGATLAYPLNLLLMRTGKDNAILKGAFFGAVTWEFIYGFGRRFKIFTTDPNMTKTHYAELFNNMLYGVATAQALVKFSEPSMYVRPQSKMTTQTTKKNSVQPIYSDSTSELEDTVFI